MERKLVAILCADVDGYSRLMGENEEATLQTLTSYRKIIDQLIGQHRGRFVNSAGDSLVAEFASVVNSVKCSVEIQTALKSENASLTCERRMEFRIGVNLGDVMVEGEQIYGDGVNVAARLESLANPGGICISRTVHENIRNKLALTFQDLGNQTVKNIAEPVQVWRVLLDNAAPTPRKETRRILCSYWRGGVFSVAGLVVIVATIALVQNLSLKPPHIQASISPQEEAALPLSAEPAISSGKPSGEPKNAIGYALRAETHLSKGDYDSAIADFDRALRSDPAFASCYTDRGVARLRKGDLSGALADFDTAIRINPGAAHAYGNRGLVRLIRGELAGALTDCNEALSLNPNLPDVYYWRGVYYQETGDFTAAVQDFHHVVNIAAPNSPLRSIARKRLQQVETLIRQTRSRSPSNLDSPNASRH